MTLRTAANPELYLSLLQFMWEGLFSTLIVRVVVTFVTTFYLKKKRSRTGRKITLENMRLKSYILSFGAQ
jgi:hypothetical protein